MVFKKLMGRLLNPEYGGLTQQDAHEVVEQFLDKLHEDLNKVTTKPYFEMRRLNSHANVDLFQSNRSCLMYFTF